MDVAQGVWTGCGTLSVALQVCRAKETEKHGFVLGQGSLHQ